MEKELEARKKAMEEKALAKQLMERNLNKLNAENAKKLHEIDEKKKNALKNKVCELTDQLEKVEKKHQHELAKKD